MGGTNGSLATVLFEARARRRVRRTEERKKYDDDEGDDTHLAGLLWRNVLGRVASLSRY